MCGPTSLTQTFVAPIPNMKTAVHATSVVTSFIIFRRKEKIKSKTDFFFVNRRMSKWMYLNANGNKDSQQVVYSPVMIRRY